ncbi:RcnB family protein [Sphingopyxis yananensis]|uniref:RcnB family protein n=1 Tax=Sphingopyxis yananensis TaxID=2886687 RepID=UPI001D127C53|nr:RcnB family protein [Sphingopyxis yananensis]MCC2603207.1 RcnB family protein [Sphingopyxis yananensis]
MKKNILTAGLIAALMVPAVASAQPSYNSHNRDHAATTQHNQRDHRYDNNRNNTRDWRQDQRYSNFRAPFAYQRFQNGSTLRRDYYNNNYRQNWDSRWGLPRANKNQVYVRHYNDLLLVNERNGKVVRVYRDMFRRR